MKNLLEPFDYKVIQEFARLSRSFLKEKYSIDDFLDFAKKEKEEALKDIFEVKFVRKNKKNVMVTKAVGNKYIVPGDLEVMSGVVCSKCQGKLYITATCCSHPLKAQGFLRKGICRECGNEFGIR